VSTITETLENLNNLSITAESLVKDSFTKMDTHGQYGAFISTQKEHALEKAAAIDASRREGKKLGALAGIPLAIKDNINIENVKTTCGSKILENFISPYNATVSQKLLNQDAILIGKTNMDEFAMGSTSESSFFGATQNPADTKLIPGGSSGGSAAVVSAGFVAGALGSDTGGSIRQPAACCGVVGLKPTYGRVSRYGLVSYASSLDQIGPITKNVADSALLLNHICGHDINDCTSSKQKVEDFTQNLNQGIQGKVIGIPKEYFGDGLDASVKTTLETSLQKLEKEGAILQEVSLPSLEHAISTYYILATAEASSNLSRFDGVRYTHRSADAKNLYELYTKSRAEGFGAEVKKRILLGTFVLSSGYYDAYYMQAQKVRRLIKNDFENAFSACDVIAAPTIATSPMKVGEAIQDPMAMYLSDIYTVSLNLAGLPGISVPVGKPSDHCSMQIFGKAFAESELLQVASNLERLR
jgi:aspartyl-tRNA(Asn)/glutamyl-tRNA(Gln) amidotransferase subunit A